MVKICLNLNVRVYKKKRGQYGALQLKGSWFKSQLRSFCVEITCSPCVDLLRFPPTVKKTCLLVKSVIFKVPVRVSVCGCLTMCGPVMGLQPVKGMPLSEIGSSRRPPITLNRGEQIQMMDGSSSLPLMDSQ